jgi:transposase
VLDKSFGPSIEVTRKQWSGNEKSVIRGIGVVSCVFMSTPKPKYKQINSDGCKMWAKEKPMKPIRIPALGPEQLDALEEMYRTTRDVRLRTRAQMVLLAAEQHLTAAEIAEIVRSSEETVRRWLKRYLVGGVEGLRDMPHPGAPRKVTAEYRERLIHTVRRRPRSLGLPFSLWPLRRLADYMAEQTGVRVEYETVRVHLKAAGIVLSRPQHTITSPDPEYALKKRRSKKPATVSKQEITSTTPASST